MVNVFVAFDATDISTGSVTSPLSSPAPGVSFYPWQEGGWGEVDHYQIFIVNGLTARFDGEKIIVNIKKISTGGYGPARRLARWDELRLWAEKHIAFLHDAVVEEGKRRDGGRGYHLRPNKNTPIIISVSPDAGEVEKELEEYLKSYEEVEEKLRMG